MLLRKINVIEIINVIEKNHVVRINVIENKQCY